LTVNFSLNLILKLYTISRNGRLNVWECDTRLDGLIKQEKNEYLTEELDTDELGNKKRDDLDESTSKMEITHEDGEKRVTITFRKKSK
jgi:hypothetical protein